MKYNALIPELTVQALTRSKHFYPEILGFQLEYERPADCFAFIRLEDIQLMLEQWPEAGWNVAPLAYPYGRGINFSMEVSQIDQLYQRVLEYGYPTYRPLAKHYYEANGIGLSQKEFLVQDPDGYLLRFTEETR